jgi:hypothetical protein
MILVWGEACLLPASSGGSIRYGAEEHRGSRFYDGVPDPVNLQRRVRPGLLDPFTAGGGEHILRKERKASLWLVDLHRVFHKAAADTMHRRPTPPTSIA